MGFNSGLKGLNIGQWTNSTQWVIPNMMYHRQNPVDLHCEDYSLAVSVVNIRCYHGNVRITCIRFASAYVPVLFSSCSCVCRLTRMEGDISGGVRNCCMKLHFLILQGCCDGIPHRNSLTLCTIDMLVSMSIPVRFSHYQYKHNGVVKDDIFSNPLWILCIVCFASTWFTVL
jgi:hypothetical protein